jgi:hypothetical protein
MNTEEFTGHVSAMRADAEFFGAEDFIGRGDVPVQIIKCVRSIDRLACGKNQKEMFSLVLNIDGKQAKKELWLKPTNRKQICRLYGPKVSNWKGQWLWLYVEEVRSPQGGMTLGIRIRDRKDAPPNAAINSQRTQEPPKPSSPALNEEYNALKSLWKARRKLYEFPDNVESWKHFVDTATGGLVAAEKALSPAAFSHELIKKCIDQINLEMPDQNTETEREDS